MGSFWVVPGGLAGPGEGRPVTSGIKSGQEGKKHHTGRRGGDTDVKKNAMEQKSFTEKGKKSGRQIHSNGESRIGLKKGGWKETLLDEMKKISDRTNVDKGGSTTAVIDGL